MKKLYKYLKISKPTFLIGVFSLLLGFNSMAIVDGTYALPGLPYTATITFDNAAEVYTINITGSVTTGYHGLGFASSSAGQMAGKYAMYMFNNGGNFGLEERTLVDYGLGTLLTAEAAINSQNFATGDISISRAYTSTNGGFSFSVTDTELYYIGASGSTVGAYHGSGGARHKGVIDIHPCTSPTPSITGTTSYCASVGNVTVSADQTYGSYSWSSGGSGQTESIEVSDGAVTLTVTDGNGCSGTSSSVTATSNDNPTPSIIGETSYCANVGSTTVSADQTYDSYSWSSGGSSISETVTTSDNSIILTVTSNGCSGVSSAVDVTEDDCTGLFDITTSSKVIIYPNPVGDELLNFSTELTNIRILTAVGELVLEKGAGSFIHVGNLKPGMYIILSKEGTSTFIKE
jgi:hypothetical protein